MLAFVIDKLIKYKYIYTNKNIIKEIFHYLYDYLYTKIKIWLKNF